jgi:hypothetical protein
MVTWYFIIHCVLKCPAWEIRKIVEVIRMMVKEWLAVARNVLAHSTVCTVSVDKE